MYSEYLTIQILLLQKHYILTEGELLLREQQGIHTTQHLFFTIFTDDELNSTTFKDIWNKIVEVNNANEKLKGLKIESRRKLAKKANDPL